MSSDSSVWFLPCKAADYSDLSSIESAFSSLPLLADTAALGGIRRVVVKPNLVLDRHPRGGDLAGLITNAVVIRVILDRLLQAFPQVASLTIGDSPLQTTDFERATESTGVAQLVADLRSRNQSKVRLADFRQVVSQRDTDGHIVAWREAPGDPEGYVTFDLGADSALNSMGEDSARFRVSNYAASDTRQYHSGHSHKYVIARSVLDADLILNVPKLKTHCKVGITVALKNFVGVVGRKQCLAHHREGGSAQGGDEYPGRSRLKSWSERLERAIDGSPAGLRRNLLKLAFRINERLIKTLGIDPVRDGGWFGNDTCWRMTLDLVRIVTYGRPDGTMADTPQRRLLTIVDGIVAGEGEGPLEAEARPTGILVAGWNPLAVDRAAARFMGFDPDKIPLLRGAMSLARWPLNAGSDSEIYFAGTRIPESDLPGKRHGPPFKPPRGWVGHIEA